jgi:hypothetical protein
LTPTAAGTDPSSVIAGLDLRFHRKSRLFVKAMDCRVKPGNDGGESASTTIGITLRFVIAVALEAIHHWRMGFWVYILASRHGGTLYVGVTRDRSQDLRAPGRPLAGLHKALSGQNVGLL